MFDRYDLLMIELTTALILFLFPLAYSPGPGNLFFAANGARFGLRSTIPATTGYHVATWLVTVVIGLGFAAVIHKYPGIFTTIKVLGSLYVLWLAWKLLRSGMLRTDQEPTVANFRDGVVLLVLNPKAYFIIAAMFAQFLSIESDDQLVLVLWISTIFTLNNFIAFTSWTIVGDRLATLFRSESNAKMMNLGFGSLLAVVAVWMFVS
jgi:threonine/homoserine/homoserine lactone efflux protein